MKKLQLKGEILAGQFAGPKAGLRPIYARLFAAIYPCAADIQLNPRQSYIALAHKKQFFMIKASTSTRLDLGLRLKNPLSNPRLEAAERLGSSSINYKVRLSQLDEVDAELVGWLQAASEGAG